MKKSFFFSVFLLLAVLSTEAQTGHFSLAPVYHRESFQSKTGEQYVFHAVGVELGMLREGRGALDFLFSAVASIPGWAQDKNGEHLTFDYYSFPSAAVLYAGPAFSMPLFRKGLLTGSLGVQLGHIQLMGSGYKSLNFLPFGVGGSLRFHWQFSQSFNIGFTGKITWNFLDFYHFEDHKTGISFVCGITAGFSYVPRRISAKGGRK